MKNHIKLIVVCLLLLTAMSCKKEQKPKEEIVEQVSEVGLPNESDIQFDNTINALESNDHIQAANYLKDGVSALKKEGEELEGDSKKMINNAITQLNTIEKSLRANKKIDVETLKEAMANAELVVGHEYLITDDIYFLTESKKVAGHISQKEFRKNLKILESTLKNESSNKAKDKDGSGQKLYNEGKALEKDLKNLMEKMDNHNKRANEHIKTHHPKKHLPTYYPLGE